MNILFYMHRYPSYGGIENVSTYLANWFVKSLYSVSIFSFAYFDRELLLKKLNNKVDYIEAVDKVDFQYLRYHICHLWRIDVPMGA